MDLQEMKASWQKAGSTEKNSAPINTYIHTKGHLAVARKVRLKLLIEAAFMALLLFVFYDIFDGDRKPLYANVALVLGALFYFSSNMLGYFTLRQVAEELNIRNSLQSLLQRLKQAKLLSLTAVVLFSLTLLLFFTSAIEFNSKKLLLLAGLLMFVLVQVYLASRLWNNRINQIQEQLDELGE